MQRRLLWAVVVCAVILGTALTAAQQPAARFENALRYLEYYTAGMDRLIPGLRPLQQAANALSESIEREESADESLLMLALVYQEQGNLAGAKEHLYEYLRRNPDHGWINVLIGDLDYLLGDADLALKSYVKALMVGEYARAYYGIGLINSQQGITPDVIGALAKAVELAPNFVDARIALAKAYIASEQFQEARGELETAYLYAPRRAEIHYYLWQIYTHEGDVGKAKHYGELAVQYDSSYAALIGAR
ncbi:MAG TPA: tetratricopeptide repeat protein [Limnochordia bacterium]|mgnify:FL=1|nr:tetratricopeptide repeat protein [Limnochordia bacterium]